MVVDVFEPIEHPQQAGVAAGVDDQRDPPLLLLLAQEAVKGARQEVVVFRLAIVGEPLAWAAAETVLQECDAGTCEVGQHRVERDRDVWRTSHDQLEPSKNRSGRIAQRAMLELQVHGIELMQRLAKSLQLLFGHPLDQGRLVLKEELIEIEDGDIEILFEELHDRFGVAGDAAEIVVGADDGEAGLRCCHGFARGQNGCEWGVKTDRNVAGRPPEPMRFVLS